MAATVSVLAGVTVWYSVASYLLSQRQEAAVSQALSNAEQVQRELGSAGASIPEVLARLPGDLPSASLVETEQDEWFTNDLTINRRSIPAALVDRVVADRQHYQRIELDGRPVLVIGLPLQDGGAYFEVFLLEELDESLRTLSLVLVAGGLVIPVVTLALGWWAMRPALRPLERVADAVAAIARGDLGARLDARGDPSLESIAESFNSTAAALERRVKMDAKFAADVSHELRSPLTTMVNSIAVMHGQRSAMSPEGCEMLDLLQAEVHGFERLVRDLLEISRADAGSQDFALVDFRLAELVQHALAPHLIERLEVSPEGDEALVRGEKRRMERVVMNLVDNADRHGRGVTRIRVDATDAEVSLLVEDSGPGLEADELEGIFDRFSRGRGSTRGTTDGAGLGLALVAQHVRQLGGGVTAENHPEGGARFVVRLPRSTSTGASC